MKIETNRLSVLFPEIEKRIRESFGTNVEKIILFGSYARGDYSNESDVDILVIVDDADLYKYRKTRAKLITHFYEDYELQLSIRIVDRVIFNRFKHDSPFFSNAALQGINIYG